MVHISFLVGQYFLTHSTLSHFQWRNRSCHDPCIESKVERHQRIVGRKHNEEDWTQGHREDLVSLRRHLEKMSTCVTITKMLSCKKPSSNYKKNPTQRDWQQEVSSRRNRCNARLQWIPVEVAKQLTIYRKKYNKGRFSKHNREDEERLN